MYVPFPVTTSEPLPVSVTSHLIDPLLAPTEPVLVVIMQVALVAFVRVTPIPDTMDHAYVNGPVPPDTSAVTATDARDGETDDESAGLGDSVTVCAVEPLYIIITCCRDIRLLRGR